uniref:BZIP domain-containing protein n=1 Tax=Macrostomum lignano TaxID=282301 RepID=A0A1I8IS52_9PLAT
FTGGGSSAGGSGENLLNFDLDSFLGGGGGGIWDDAEDDDGLESGGGIGAKPEGQPGEPLLLTAEEQRVARQLGAVLPSHFPLTREELQILRTVRRKIRNKISAKNSRAKKQEYVRGLELRVKGSAAENAALRDRCTGLEQQNRRLLGAVRRLQAFLRSSGLSLTSTAGKATGTGLFILCLSFALFLTPQLGPLLVAGPGAPGVAD